MVGLKNIQHDTVLTFILLHRIRKITKNVTFNILHSLWRSRVKYEDCKKKTTTNKTIWQTVNFNAENSTVCTPS